MASIFKLLSRHGADFVEEWKQTGTDSNGNPIYAHVVALEPNSIGGGGGGPSTSVTIADATTSSQKAAVDAGGALLTDPKDRAGRLLGHVTVDNASLAVTQSGSWTDDVTDRAARLLGHVTVDSVSGDVAVINSTTVGKTKIAVTPDPTDITDRSARLLGHVTVDNASLAVTGPLTDTQLRASAVTVDVNDRAARLLGHVTVDNATLAVTQSGTWTVQPGNTANSTPWLVDVSDRAARLLGVVYGSQGQQLKQTATNFNLQSELAVGGTLIDPRSIRALTSADVVSAAQSGTWTVQQGTPPWTVKGDQARASATIPNPVVAGLRAANYPTKPTAVTAGQLVDQVADLEGVIYTRPRQINTFSAIYRLALGAASSKLAFTFTANTDKQLATIYHANTATKTVRIRRVWVQIISTGAVAGEIQLELRRLTATTAPATGNPAITPVNRDPGGATVEATCLALPTTAGSETLTNSPIASSIVNLAASAGTASGTGLVPQDPGWIKLYDEANADDEEVAPTIRSGNAEGYAVVGRSTAAVPLNFIVRIVFTEE